MASKIAENKRPIESYEHKDKQRGIDPFVMRLSPRNLKYMRAFAALKKGKPSPSMSGRNTSRF